MNKKVSNKKIKIVHLGLPFTGVGTYLSSIIGNMDPEIFESILIAGKDADYPIKDKLNRNIKIYSIDVVREIKPIHDFKALLSIIRILNIEKPNIIHTHSSKFGFLGIIAGWWTGIVTFYTPHAFSYLSTNSWIKKSAYLVLEKISRKFGGFLIATSNSEKKRGISDVGYAESMVNVWPNSIRDIDFVNQISGEEWALPWNDYACSIGRPSFQKNFQMMIEVINNLKIQGVRLNLVILGVGFYSPEETRIRELILKNHLSDQIVLIEHMERLRAISILQNATLYLSTSRYEGLPISMLEAMALSKACIATEVDGNVDCLVDNHNGYLIPLNKVELMAIKVRKLLENKKLRDTMGFNGRKMFLENFEISKNISKLEEIYLKEIN